MKQNTKPLTLNTYIPKNKIMTILIIIIIWASLGAHSAYYLVKGITKRWDFTTSDVPQLIMAIIFPIIAHFATYLIYYSDKKEEKILWRKQP